MSRDFDGSTDELRVTTARSAYPVTLAGWFKADAETSDQTIISISADGQNDEYIQLLANEFLGSSFVSLIVSDGTSGAHQLNTTNAYSADVWQHAAAVLTSAGSRAVFVNGGGKNTTTASRNPTGEDATTIGALDLAAGLTARFDGKLAELAIWDEALTDAEIAALAAGLNPRQVRPHALLPTGCGYWPVWGMHSPEFSYYGSDLTVSSPSAALLDHPPLLGLGRAA